MSFTETRPVYEEIIVDPIVDKLELIANLQISPPNSLQELQAFLIENQVAETFLAAILSNPAEPLMPDGPGGRSLSPSNREIWFGSSPPGSDTQPASAFRARLLGKPKPRTGSQRHKLQRYFDGIRKTIPEFKEGQQPRVILIHDHGRTDDPSSPYAYNYDLDIPLNPDGTLDANGLFMGQYYFVTKVVKNHQGFDKEKKRKYYDTKEAENYEHNDFREGLIFRTVSYPEYQDEQYSEGDPSIYFYAVQHAAARMAEGIKQQKQAERVDQVAHKIVGLMSDRVGLRDGQFNFWRISLRD